MSSDPSKPPSSPDRPFPDLDLNRPPAFDRVAIADPDSVRAAPGRVGAPGDLVLLIGADVPTAVAAIGAGGAADMAGFVISRELPTIALSDAAAPRRVPCYRMPAGATWAEVHQALTAALTDRLVDRAADLGQDDDLAALAQTIATLTGGLVSIEDTSARVLAYSRSTDEVDDLRRLSILGRSGPADYLDLLRQWGVYDRLAASEEVVEIADHPETGVRRRLAVGVFAGQRQLGTIWVQQGDQEFGPHAKQALLGAARLTAGHLVDRQTRSRPMRASAGSGIDAAALLSGRPARSAGFDRRTAERPCVVVAFDAAQRTADLAVHPPPADRTTDGPARRLLLESLLGVITVHAAALRGNAATALIGDRAYLLLPGVDSLPPVRRVATAIVDAARRHLDAVILAAIGPIVATADAAPRSRSAADLALAASIAGDLPANPVVDFDSARPALVAEAAVDALAARQELNDPRIDELVRSDPESARTLLAYLDSGSRAQVVADELRVHVTTVRYRLRKAESAIGPTLDSADARLAAQLQLRFVLRPTRT